MRLISVLAFFVAALAHLHVTDSCMCMPTHPQNAFCKSDFVLKAVITSRRRYAFIKNYEVFVQMGIPPPRMAYYGMSVEKVFKGQDKIKQLLEKSIIYTHSKDAINNCVSLFKKGEKYLLAGRVVDGKMETSMCDLNNEWHHVTKHMKRGINGAYDCSCPVATCIDGYCDRENSCKWNTTWDKSIDECSMKYRTCTKTKQNCGWSASSQFNDCANSP